MTAPGRRWTRGTAAKIALAAVLVLVAVDQVLLRIETAAEGSLLHRVLREPLEERFERSDIGDASGFTGLIVVGGSFERLREAGRLARQFPSMRLVVCERPRYLRLLGPDIDPARIELEAKSETTWQNAVEAHALVKPKAGARWLLVTSAAHMPRAMGVFRKAGFDVVAWPVPDTPKQYVMYRMVRHEWVGLIGYAILGRSSDLFPGPA